MHAVQERQIFMELLDALPPLRAAPPPPAPGPGLCATPPPAAPQDIAPLAVPPEALPSEHIMPEGALPVAGDSEAPSGVSVGPAESPPRRTATDEKAGARFALVIACAVAAGIAAGLCATAAVLAAQRRRQEWLAQQALAATLKVEPVIAIEEPHTAFGNWPVRRRSIPSNNGRW